MHQGLALLGASGLVSSVSQKYNNERTGKRMSLSKAMPKGRQVGDLFPR